MQHIRVIIPKGFALAILVDGQLIAVSVKPTIKSIATAIQEHGSLDSVIFNPNIDTKGMQEIVWADTDGFCFYQMDGLDEDYCGCEDNYELVHIY